MTAPREGRGPRGAERQKTRAGTTYCPWHQTGICLGLYRVGFGAREYLRWTEEQIKSSKSKVKSKSKRKNKKIKQGVTNTDY